MSESESSDDDDSEDHREEQPQSLANDKGKEKQDTKHKELPKRPHKHAYVPPLFVIITHSLQTHRDILQATRYPVQNSRRGEHM